MESRKRDIIELVNRAKEEIEKIKKSSIENKETIDEINSLKVKLKEIEDALKPNQQNIKRRIASLNSILEELSDIKSDIVLSMEEEMFNVIGKNLLDGMVLEKVVNTENLKSIIFKDEEVGNIEILEDCRPDIKIRVKVYNNVDEFTVQDTFKMYSIISFINTKFNYKQE